MSRYPFSDHIDEYLDSNRSALGSEESVDTARRRLRSMGRTLHQLRSERAIGSDNPAVIAVKDIQAYADRRRSEGVSDGTVRRELGYLDGYLRYFDNDSAEILLRETDDRTEKRYEDSSAKALKGIIRNVSGKESMRRRLETAYSFVILVIVLGIRPEQLRTSRFLVGAEPGYIMDRHIEYTDDHGNRIRRKLDLDRMPVVKNYTFRLFTSELHRGLTSSPMFPSLSPMFDYIGPNEVRGLKKEVEKDIGYEFDYRICQRLYRQMLDDDGRPEVKTPSQPMLGYYPDNRSFIGKVWDAIVRRTASQVVSIPMTGLAAGLPCGRQAGAGPRTAASSPAYRYFQDGGSGAVGPAEAPARPGTNHASAATRDSDHDLIEIT